MTKARAGADLTTPQLEALLAGRFSAPEWALLFNVKNRTGYGGAERFADAVAMNLYPSRGLEVVGFELKVSRGDWLRELKDPAKAEAISRYCDRWYLVVADDAIVLPGELPPTWGLLHPHGSALRVKTEAPKLEAQPLDRRFVAAFVRRAAEASPDDVAAAERRGFERGHKQGTEEAARDIERHQDNAKRIGEESLRLRQEVLQFEQAAGLSITGWQARNSGGPVHIGDAVRLVLGGKLDRQLTEYRDQLERLLHGADESLAALAALRERDPLAADTAT